MRRILSIGCIFLLAAAASVSAEDVTTFHAYIDSDLCARLMLGPITQSRIDCSQKTYKEGSNSVLVRLNDNTVFSVNKEKLLKEYVGQLASVTGEAKVKSGTMKLQAVMPEEVGNIPQGDPARKLLDVRTYKTNASAAIHEKVRHELAMIAYITEFDFISFTLVDDTVILTGWTVRATNRGDAAYRAKSVEGVRQVINNIEELPLNPSDMQIRADARARLQRVLSTYFWSNGSDVKIIVKNGNIILLGSVRTQQDSDAATIQAKSVPLAFHVFNLLRVVPPAPKEKKG
jgi:osmotically-inducible protein OsmY